MIPNHFILQMSLICHMSNIFKCTCDFLVGRTTTLDLQWRASHYLKRLLWPNIKMNKIASKKTKT